jgi:coenzyme F420-0:L-glutamate ligase/coenzyme F420-1:gamma-L-glutamate ligase
MAHHPRLPEVRVFGLPGLPEIASGDDLVELIVAAVRRAGLTIQAGDVFVVTHKIVSKAEGRLVPLAEVKPSPLAERWGAPFGKDTRLFELALRAARRIVRMDRGVLIAETLHGFVCANAGVDSSNVADEAAALLPEDPDASARRLCTSLREASGQPVAVIISDSFGRAWREGQVNVALGVAGLRPIVDYRGRVDVHGHRLQATAIAIADELASAAELVMGKMDAIPVALIKGARYEPGEGSARELVRAADQDLFR